MDSNSNIVVKPAGMSDDDDERDNCDSFENKKESLINGSSKLFSFGMDVDYEAKTLEHKIITASRCGNLEVFEQHLRDHNVNDILNSGWTVLMHSASQVKPKIMEYLLAHGANPNLHKDGYTAMSALCSSMTDTTSACLECLKLLIDAGGDVNVHDSLKITPLMYACQRRKPEFISELLKYVKKVNACDSDKQTALFYAVLVKEPSIVNMLLEKGADITIKNRQNLTAKDVAIFKGYEKIIPLFGNTEENEVQIVEVSKIHDWRTMFPRFYPNNFNVINFDVQVTLYGMALQRYDHLFKGMDLKIFLQLTEEDLIRLGMDIGVHRVRFIENLHRFHTKKWKVRSIGTINKNCPYTIFDGVVSFGIVVKQISVINSSINYIKNLIAKHNRNDFHLDDEQDLKYKEIRKKTYQTLNILKNELQQVKTLANKINIENDIGVPACYIGSKKKTNWPVILSIVLITGISLYKVQNVLKY